MLDVGCGIGYIARNLIERVESIDAVDFSQAMIEQGKRLPNGDDPRLHWLYGSVEELSLTPPYALVTAGESIHWMNWDIVLPRFHELLAPGGYLAIVNKGATPDPWSILSDVVPEYTTNRGRRRDVVLELEERGLFQKVGARRTAPVAFVQSIDDYIASYHSRSGFSRERMGQEKANAFDHEAKKALLRTHPDGIITLQIVASIVWEYQPAKSRNNITNCCQHRMGNTNPQNHVGLPPLRGPVAPTTNLSLTENCGVWHG